MKRIFFDTNVFIYMFEGLEPNRSRMLEIRKRTLERGDRIVTSAMTLGEVLVKPTKLGQVSLIEQYDKAIRATSEVISFDPKVAWRYASLRATHNIRNADAIFVLADGAIVETGRHEDLVRKGGLYSELCRIQFGSEGP